MAPTPGIQVSSSPSTKTSINSSPCSGCHSCGMNPACVALGGGDQGFVNEKFARFVKRRRVERDKLLHREGERLEHIAVVRTGHFAVGRVRWDGHMQPIAFPMSGDTIGLDGIATESHQNQSVALEDSEVCEIPYWLIREESRDRPAVMQHLTRLLANDVARNQESMLMLGSMSAEQRVALFLLRLSDSYKRRNYSATRFLLRMARSEIGLHLGLTIETISRMLTRFRTQGLITLHDQRDVELTDLHGLRALAGGGNKA